MAMTVTHPFAGILECDSPETAIWHGRPLSRHAFGILHAPGDTDASGDGVVDTSATPEEAFWTPRHWPSIAHSTVYHITLDALNVWFEGSGTERADYERVATRWWPTHIAPAWRAGPVTVTLDVAMTDLDGARVRATVANTGTAPIEGRIVVRGDDNKLNCTCNGQAWARSHETHAWHDGRTVVSTRKVDWGVGLEYFPYHYVLREDDRTFEWLQTHYALALDLPGNAWTRSDVATESGFTTWQCEQAVRLDPGASFDVELALVGAWYGRVPPAPDAAELLARRARRLSERRTLTAAVAANRDLWTDLLERVPAPRGDWSDDIARLYYKAWTSALYNTLAPCDMILHNGRHTQGTCNKIGDSTMTMCPATWESSLVALLLSLVDPALACDVMEGVYDGIQEDGYNGELPGSPRSTQLPAVEPFVVWACFRASGDRTFLERIYPRMRANLLYKAHHPTWMHHALMMVRNLAYVHSAAHYAGKVAAALGRPEAEQDEFRRILDHSRRAVSACWNEEGGFFNSNLNPTVGGFGRAETVPGTDAEALMPLFLACREEWRPRVLQVLRDEFLTEGGAIRRSPKTIPFAYSGSGQANDTMREFTIKESNHMFLLKAVKDLDRSLFDRIARGSLETIRGAGDFFECYDLQGRGRHNGPGGIFGAFAAIWAVLLSDDRVDHLYD